MVTCSKARNWLNTSGGASAVMAVPSIHNRIRCALRITSGALRGGEISISRNHIVFVNEILPCPSCELACKPESLPFVAIVECLCQTDIPNSCSGIF